MCWLVWGCLLGFLGLWIVCGLWFGFCCRSFLGIVGVVDGWLGVMLVFCVLMDGFCGGRSCLGFCWLNRFFWGSWWLVGRSFGLVLLILCWWWLWVWWCFWCWWLWCCLFGEWFYWFWGVFCVGFIGIFLWFCWIWIWLFFCIYVFYLLCWWFCVVVFWLNYLE